MTMPPKIWADLSRDTESEGVWWDRGFDDSIYPPIAYIRADRVEKLVEALRFYADAINWQTNHFEAAEAEADGGMTARATITEWEAEQ